jgi:hypothetical protein
MNGGVYGKIIELNEELSIVMFDDTRGYWLALLRLFFCCKFLDVFAGCFLVSWFQIFTSVSNIPDRSTQEGLPKSPMCVRSIHGR